MAYMKEVHTWRSNEEVDKMMEKLLKKHPEIYENESFLIRIAIIKLYNQEVLGKK